MVKKAVLVISLVDESTKKSNPEIEKEIIRELFKRTSEDSLAKES